MNPHPSSSACHRKQSRPAWLTRCCRWKASTLPSRSESTRCAAPPRQVRRENPVPSTQYPVPSRTSDKRESDEHQVCGGSSMSAEPEQASTKILIIDGNVFFARRLGEALKREGFEVVHSPQTAYALTMLEWDTPTAILCATNLREMGAHDIPRILHSDIK